MPEADRLRGLVEAGIALSSQLSLDDLLRKLAETAAPKTTSTSPATIPPITTPGGR